MRECILVTGGAGYIGSHTCKALAKAGYVPITFDDFSTGFHKVTKWGPVVVGDIRNVEAVTAALVKFRPVAAIHFAGKIAVGESVVEPALHYDANVIGTLSLLTALRGAGVDRVVFSSSAAVYGTPRSNFIAETHPIAPVNPYGRTKAMVEAILDDYRAAYGLRSIALRYFNASGADPDGETGELHDPETHLIPLALAACEAEGSSLKIFGDDYPTPDGTCIRDYVHVSDLADAHVVALGLLGAGDCPAALNVGTGHGYSVAQVVETVETVTGHQVKREMAPRRSGDPAALVADCTKLRQVSNWQPRRSDLSTIVATAWQWHQRCRLSETKGVQNWRT